MLSQHKNLVFLWLARCPHADAQHRNLGTCAFHAHHQPGLRACAAGGMHQFVDVQTHIHRLVGEFQRGSHIAQSAQRIGAAAGDDVGLAALGPQLRGQVFHGLVHRRVAGNFAHVRAVQMVQKHIARMLVIRVAVAGAVFQNDVAFHAHLGGDGSGLARVVGLRGTLGDEGVRALLHRVGDQVFQLAGLVAASSQSGAVIALDPQIGATQCGCEAVHGLQRRGAVGDAQAGEFGEFHAVLSWSIKRV